MNISFDRENARTMRPAPDPNLQRKARTAAVVVAVLVLALVLLSQAFYTINEQENAVVVTFGSPAAVTEPGLHLKVPFVQQVRKVDMTIKSFPIGYDINTNESIPDESLMITADYNFVNVDFFVEYRVTDPVKAIYASREPVEILKEANRKIAGMVKEESDKALGQILKNASEHMKIRYHRGDN